MRSTANWRLVDWVQDFDNNGVDDDVAVVKFRHCRFDTNFDGVLYQSTNALNIDFVSSDRNS